LATLGSLRWGELMALESQDVDLAARTVRVRRAVSEVDGRLVVGPPKPRASKRTVAIPAGIVPVLREHLAMFAEPGPVGRVFVGPKGATVRRTNFQATWWKAAGLAGRVPLPRSATHG
jgi:integrase